MASRNASAEELQGEVLSPLYRRFSLVRIVAVPALFVLLNLLFVGDAASWRRWLLAGGFLAAIAYSWFDHRRLQREGFGAATVARNIVFFFIIVPTLVLATGGLEGPLAAMLLGMSLFLNILIGGRAGAAFALFSVVFVWILALTATRAWVPDLIPTALGGGARAGHSDVLLYTTAATLSLLTLWVARVGRFVRGLFERITARAMEARDDALAAHHEHAQTLTTLTGEIAHELKNPLASVKGLAALIAKDVEGRPAERLAVLRREVDRMQEILEQFLNFSRPLVPLALEYASVVELCRSVAQLHEGFAHERGIELLVREEASAHVRCDPRKIRQILINLVQNAIEASPPSTAVELLVEPAPGRGARVSVSDRGPGLPAAIALRIFEPGVTSKETGSGLGLSVARLLARQHGGDVILTSRDGGGTCAQLLLPAEPGPGTAGDIP